RSLLSYLFFITATATTHIYTLSLHDALPISFTEGRRLVRDKGAMDAMPALKKAVELDSKFALAHSNLAVAYYNLNQNALAARLRSEEHTSELQSRSDLVCRLLLEKKKKKKIE